MQLPEKFQTTRQLAHSLASDMETPWEIIDADPEEREAFEDHLMYCADEADSLEYVAEQIVATQDLPDEVKSRAVKAIMAELLGLYMVESVGARYHMIQDMTKVN